MVMKYALAAAALVGALMQPAAAQETVDTFVLPAFNGIAVSQAAEAAPGVCFGPLAEDAISCAVEQCMAQSGQDEAACAPTLWCYPHRWVADIYMQHAEGPTWHKFLCDQPDRASLDAAIQLECNKDYLIGCEVARIWDNDGQQVVGEGADPQLPTPEELEQSSSQTPVPQ